jgi:hypothetical protein
MKVKDLIRRLKSYDPEYEIRIVASNGLLVPPGIKLILKDKYDVLNKSKDNIDYLILK